MFCAPNPCTGTIDVSLSSHNGITLTQERECSVHPTHAREQLDH